jgi:hypothetical protein
MKVKLFAFLALTSALLLAACGGGNNAFTNGSGNGGANAVASIDLIASSPTLLSDGSVPVDITAFVHDTGNRLLADVTVALSTSSGQLAVSRAKTDASGTALAALTPGSDRSNRTVTVTATAGTVQKTLTVDVVGTTLTISGPTALALAEVGNYQIVVKNAGGKGIPGQTITLSSALGNALSATTATSDSAGSANVTLTAGTGGTDTLTASTLGITTTAKVVVNSDSFAFSTPAVGTEIPLTGAPPSTTIVTVNWKQNSTPVVGQVVSFTTTRGIVTPTAATTDANGNATVGVYSDADAGSAVITATVAGGQTATRAVEFIATTPAAIDAQANPFTIAPQETSTIAAIVRDAKGNFVKNQIVDFTLSDTTNGTISQASATTNSQGNAQTVYTASTSTSATNGVKITAKVRSVPTIFHDTFITVARRELFISLGTGNEISEPNVADYLKIYSVRVTDANGTGVKGISLIMDLVSTRYYKGYRSFRAVSATDCTLPSGMGTFWFTCYTEEGVPARTFTPVQGDGTGCADEDLNHNGVLDVPPASPVNEDVNNSLQIEAGNIASVSPRNVVTDDNGTALVNVTYPQEYAYYVEVRLSASTTVQGTEFVRSSYFMLPGLASDFNKADTGPPGPISHFGQATNCTTWP